MRLITGFCALPALGMLARSCTAVTAASMASYMVVIFIVVKSNDFHNCNSFKFFLPMLASPVKLKGLQLVTAAESNRKPNCIFKLNTD